MSIKIRPHLLLAILISLYGAPAFSTEEVKAAVTTPTDGTGTMTKEMARDMVKSGMSGGDAVARITSPADGSTIKAMTRNKLKYQVSGTDAIHAQLYINGKKSVFLRKSIGTKRVAKLPAGVHELCVQALDKSHKKVGAASCIKVTAL